MFIHLLQREVTPAPLPKTVIFTENVFYKIVFFNDNCA